MKKYRDQDAKLMARFVENVQVRMKKLDMTRLELAERSDVPQSNICGILKHKHIPTITTANRLANALGVDLQDLLK